MVGDPALDFTGLPDFLSRAALASYDLPVDETLFARAVRYWQIEPFHEVHYGLKIGTRTHVEAGLSGIRERIIKAE